MAGRVRIFPVGGGAPRTLAETPDTQPTIIGWAPDGTQIYVSEVAGVGACILALPTDGAPPVPLNGPRMFEATRLSSSGQLTVVSEDLDQPNAIVQIDCASGAAREFYRPPLPANWPTSPLPRAEVVQWQSPDGTPIEGIVTYPLNYQVGQAYPLVVVIHGGPTGTYQCSYLGSSAGYAPICSLAERGYATLRCNPRGSSGYGRTFRFANERDWGGGDYHDILAGVDLLIAQGLADPARLAVMGWSYGGFMASWIITQTNRFVAACIGAPVTDPISFNGTADIPSFIPDYFGGEYWEAFENYRRQSPLLHIANIQTPALIQHGEADIRVPLGQGRQLFQALRRRGIATELIVYPRQGHLFSEPRMIIDSRERVLEWLGRYLKEPATSK
jgi:dipeptidyl aminopeptidase/acylaminoacyl peptidase